MLSTFSRRTQETVRDSDIFWGSTLNSSHQIVGMNATCLFWSQYPFYFWEIWRSGGWTFIFGHFLCMPREGRVKNKTFFSGGSTSLCLGAEKILPPSLPPLSSLLVVQDGEGGIQRGASLFCPFFLDFTSPWGDLLSVPFYRKFSGCRFWARFYGGDEKCLVVVFEVAGLKNTTCTLP